MVDDADAVGGPGGHYEATAASKEDSAAVLGATVVEAMAMVEAIGLVKVKSKTRNGSPSSSWADRLKT